MRLVAAIVVLYVLFQLQGLTIIVSSTLPRDDNGPSLTIELIPRAEPQVMPKERWRPTPGAWLDPLEPPEPERAHRRRLRD